MKLHRDEINKIKTDIELPDESQAQDNIWLENKFIDRDF